MRLRPLFFIFLLSIIAVKPSCYAADEAELPPIVITPSRIPEETPLRSVSYINSGEFDEAIGSSITDLVNDLPSIDVRERGVRGVQADLNIRGATFEESMVLLNGVRFNDPQTGHHNMDIPFTSMDLESIELVRGGQSALYGPDAFGGTVNFITKRPGERRVTTAFSMGQNGLFREAVSITQPVKNLKNRVSFERSDSSGYRGKETSFHITTFSFDSLLETDAGEVEVIGGYLYKDFGASTFYSSLYPNEHEMTDTRAGMIRMKFEEGMVSVEPKFYYRRHWDRFILDNDRPFWYRNTHKTYTLGSDIQTTVTTDLGTIIFGTELSWDKIDSTNLDKHKRDREAVFFGYNHKFPSGFLVNANIRTDWFSAFGWEFSPQIGLGYSIDDKIVLRSSVNRAYRIPSFTDLYYVDPGNIGDASLKPESAWSYEGGIDYKDKFITISTTVFNRNGRNIIDWVRDSKAQPWRATNAGKIDTFGVENLIEIKPGEIWRGISIEKVSLGYDFINSDKKSGTAAFSKYALDYLRHNFSLGVTGKFPFGIEE
ncbi:MAG: TonB-dependent receptor, partial [Candidatus Omnitrophica bacterium]|nr:TonB-dependent receptor [Candidatus Omnitrophota bacterium]MBU4488634.1 TonB-dependent receptor [Candidatus Omnitrophota bacterium]